MATMPAQKPGQSKQDYCTPLLFLNAVRRQYLGIVDFDCDLAATAENSVCEAYYDREQDALTQPWKLGDGWNWLNPEFADIGPWAEYAHAQMKNLNAKTAMLVPAGVGANWWRDHVHGKCRVLLLNGRLCFIKDWETVLEYDDAGNVVGRLYTSAPLYPKDCALLLYCNHWVERVDYPQYEIWSWKSTPAIARVPA